MNERIPSFWSKYNHYQKSYLTADLSTRKYFRWKNSNHSLILMDSPDLESLNAFITIDQYLREQHLSAPEIIESDPENGFLLLEDFGDSTFTKVLQNSPTREAEIYKCAINVLVHLHERTPEQLPFLKVYDVDFGLNKVRNFLNHYYTKAIDEKISTASENEFINAWQLVISLALEAKKLFSYEITISIT